MMPVRCTFSVSKNSKDKSKSRLLLHLSGAAASCFMDNIKQRADETTSPVLVKDLLNLRKAA
jgi:hypothetical protein